MDDEKTVLLSEAANNEQTTYVEENTENIINRSPIWKSPKFIIVAVLCLIAVIVTITIVISSAGGGDDDIAHKLETARKYLTEMKYEEAKAIYEEIIKAEPKCEDAYIGLADAYVGLGDEDKAAEVLEEGMDKIGETSELKKKLKEVEKKQDDKDEDDEKDTNKETKTTEEVTEETTAEPEGDTMGETAVNQPQPTTASQQETTGQPQMETQQPTGNSTDIAGMYAKEIVSALEPNWLVGVREISLYDINSDGILDLRVFYETGNGGDTKYMIYSAGRISTIYSADNAAGRSWYSLYRNTQTGKVRIVSEWHNGFSPEGDSYTVYDEQEDGSLIDTGRAVYDNFDGNTPKYTVNGQQADKSAFDTFEENITNGYENIQWQQDVMVEVNRFYPDCSEEFVKELLSSYFK